MSDKELTARINVLEAKVAMLYTLRKEEREKLVLSLVAANITNDDSTKEVLARLLSAIADASHDYASHSKFEAAANRLTAAEDEARLHLEALALVPDNRVDGNGLRIVDLEAVDDELAAMDAEFETFVLDKAAVQTIQHPGHSFTLTCRETGKESPANKERMIKAINKHYAEPYDAFQQLMSGVSIRTSFANYQLVVDDRP